MVNHPIVKPGDRIEVGFHDCIVQELYPPDSEVYVCWVVYLHQGKPTKCPISWDGEKWYIPDTDVCTYARESEPFVHELKELGESTRWLYAPRK